MKIPPLNPFYVFSLVAEHQSLLLVSQILGVTQSAVSRQISTLEEYYGCRLFKRKKHGLELLPFAKELAKSSSDAFNLIEKSSENFTKVLQNNEKNVVIKTYTSFAGNWLIPNLNEFCALYPDIKLTIKTGAKSIDFKGDEADISIQILNRERPGYQTTLLFEDVIEPVCSPEFLDKFAPNKKFPSSILRKTLISTDYRDFDWETWIEKCDYAEDFNPENKVKFANAILAWDAAINGIGVAMGQPILLNDKISAGKLVTPFNLPVKTGRKYYAILPEKNIKNGALLFKSWLLKKFQCETSQI